MIINGASRANWRFFSKHLVRTDHNERVEISEIRGVFAGDVREALREMHAVASGSQTKNFLYHANLNPAEGEQLTAEQWQGAVDRLERNLGLDGHARIVVEHEKEGRVHRHVLWQRVDPETMTAVSDSHDYYKHQQTARELEEEYRLARTSSVLGEGRDAERPERRAKKWEDFRAADSKIDPLAMRAELTDLWQSADSGLAFVAALEDAGYVLARGDRRDFCVIDQAADEHSLARRIAGAKAADIRKRLSDIDRESLPSVAEARAIMRSRTETESNQGQAFERNADPLPEAEAASSSEPVTHFDRADYEPAASFDQAHYEPVNPADLAGREPSAPVDWEAVEARARRATGAGDDIHRVTPWGRAWAGLVERVQHYHEWIAERWSQAQAAEPASEAETWAEYVTRTGASAARVAGELWQERIKPALGGLGRFLADESGAGETPFSELERRASRWLSDEEPAEDDVAGSASPWGKPQPPVPGTGPDNAPGPRESDAPDMED